MKGHKWYAVLLFFVVLLIFPSNGLWAASYYQGKIIKIIVGAPPGGGYDRLARVLAMHLPRHIPGQPKIIIENMPAGSSIVAANYIYNIAKPDGLTIGTVNLGILIGQLMKVDGIRFDFRQFTWLGSISDEIILFCIRGDLPYKTFSEFRATKKDIFIAVGGPISRSAQFVSLIKEFLSQNITVVNYPGTTPLGLAVIVDRKEADGMANAYSLLKPAIDRGDLRPLLRGRSSNFETKNLPVDENLVTDKIGKNIMSIRSTLDEFSRPFIAPPGISKETAEILRNAFIKVSKDPLFLKDAAKSLIPIEYVSAERSLRLTNQILDQPPKVVEAVKKYIKF